MLFIRPISRDSLVGICLTVRGSKPVRARFSIPVQNGAGFHPATCTVGTESLSLEVKRPGRDEDQPNLSTPRLKEGRTIHLLLIGAFKACCKVNFAYTYVPPHRDSIISTLTFKFSECHSV